MSIASFFGGVLGGAATGVVSPAAQIVDGASKIIGMFKLDPAVKAQLQAQLIQDNVDIEKAELAANLAQVQGQLDIDKQEAASTSIWVAGPRPAVMWVCAAALAWNFVLLPFLQFFLVAIHKPLIAPLPVLDAATLISGLLVPMLGLGGLRTYEKIQGAPGADKLQ